MVTYYLREQFLRGAQFRGQFEHLIGAQSLVNQSTWLVVFVLTLFSDVLRQDAIYFRLMVFRACVLPLLWCPCVARCRVPNRVPNVVRVPKAVQKCSKLLQIVVQIVFQIVPNVKASEECFCSRVAGASAKHFQRCAHGP